MVVLVVDSGSRSHDRAPAGVAHFQYQCRVYLKPSSQRMARFFLHSIQLASIFLAKCLFPVAHAQSIATNTVPPLQWLNITGLIQGPPAPALRYPSIGYDDTTRTLIIFGGESSSGIATSQTFLFVISLPFSSLSLTI